MDSQDPDTSSKQSGSPPLFSLPPELRNRIYQYGLRDQLSIGACWHQPPITRVNRQMREESLSLFYATTAFVAHQKTDIAGWLHAIGETNASRIRRIIWYDCYVGREISLRDSEPLSYRHEALYSARPRGYGCNQMMYGEEEFRELRWRAVFLLEDLKAEAGACERWEIGAAGLIRLFRRCREDCERGPLPSGDCVADALEFFATG
ncbi:hypothetical protein LTR66_017933 [Elasticomyces elasticus]|nr:hypothetical protein LTR66_017933 [Elasticomyces elasticus]